MAGISLKNIGMTYDNNVKVIENLNLEIPDGSFTVLVGPSGCGKSTLLRMIAGLETPTNGDLFIGDERVNDHAPGNRDIAMVFQNYALYPTMTVKENIEFGLINAKVPKKERERLIADVSEIVGLGDYLKRMPKALSGGQRQRVALARALVKQPKVFLLDEPLSNLDARLRNQMRFELIQLHKRLGTTFVYVTHDQVEAMSMGNKIVLMNQGKIMSQGTPKEIYNYPTNMFTAQFIGTPPMNFFSEKDSLAFSNNKYSYAGIRPEKMKVLNDNSKVDIAIEALVVSNEHLGSENLYTIEYNGQILQVKDYGLNEFCTDKMGKFGFNRSDVFFYDQNQNLVTEK